MSRLVIIGGSGFLGSHLIDILNKHNKIKIVVLDIVKPKCSNVDFEFCDISKSINFEFEKDDIVIHLAARQYHLTVPKKDILKFFTEVNTDGTRRILEGMQKCGTSKMIYFSSDMVYGIPDEVPVPVSHKQNPVGEYGLSKKLSEKICREFREKGFNITIFRPRMIIGKGRLGILVKLFKLMEYSLPVPMIGGGNNSYQMVSVDDCASAILCAIGKGIPNKEFNLGSENPPKVKTLLKNLIKEIGSKSILIPTWGKGIKILLSVLGKCGIRIMYKEQYTIADINYLVSIKETKKELNWSPQYNDAQMLKEAYLEYKMPENK